MSTELTEAERAAVEALAKTSKCSLRHIHGDECRTAQARAVVAAVRPIIEAEITGQRAECPDLFCAGWKDSGICPNTPKYRHNP
jgi:hypothetical protein